MSTVPNPDEPVDPSPYDDFDDGWEDDSTTPTRCRGCGTFLPRRPFETILDWCQHCFVFADLGYLTPDDRQHWEAYKVQALRDLSNAADYFAQLATGPVPPPSIRTARRRGRPTRMDRFPTFPYLFCRVYRELLGVHGVKPTQRELTDVIAKEMAARKLWQRDEENEADRESDVLMLTRWLDDFGIREPYEEHCRRFL